MTEGEGRLVAGRYRLREALGRGGMGVVWLASDEFLHRDVAIKEIQPRGREIHDTDPEVRRALREARAAAKLSEHPGIITVHDVVTDERGLPWIVMQLLNGHSLNVVLDDEGPMPVDRAARIGILVLRALDYAHNAGVLHRDVKPANVMLVGDEDDGDKVVLTDFGIAVIDGASVLTATGQLPGAPEYISPERILGEEALPAADLWSVGIMLYGMVVGRTPFHRADIQATLGAALTREPDPDPSVGRLAPVIEGLLRKKPAERMTARQAIDKLSEIAVVPASTPTGVRVRLEYPTLTDNAAGATTVVDATRPNTRTALPPFAPPPPPQVSHVAPDAPTLDTVPPRPTRSKRSLLIVGGALVAVVAVVVTAVLLLQGRDGEQDPSASGSTTVETTPNPPLTEHDENLGFTIGIPEGWTRDSSVDAEISEVSWQAEQVDPTVGALEVRVRRDTTKPGVGADAYLADVARAQETNRDILDYKPVRTVVGDAASADLEYTYQAAAGVQHYHVWVRAIAAGDVHYTLTFQLYANDAGTTREQWEAAQPLVAEIRNSFRVT
ncbi:serine/threonine-protein kinase [Actinophytocola sp.]|uniref:serine/threonine-protein kinase n=1 Tax=Actinophytocola sp. TaxID=1872138 RepID=UPI002ED6664C